MATPNRSCEYPSSSRYARILRPEMLGVCDKRTRGSLSNDQDWRENRQNNRSIKRNVEFDERVGRKSRIKHTRQPQENKAKKPRMVTTLKFGTIMESKSREINTNRAGRSTILTSFAIAIIYTSIIWLSYPFSSKTEIKLETLTIIILWASVLVSAINLPMSKKWGVRIVALGIVATSLICLNIGNNSILGIQTNTGPEAFLLLFSSFLLCTGVARYIKHQSNSSEETEVPVNSPKNQLNATRDEKILDTGISDLLDRISAFEKRITDSEIQANNLQFAFNDLRDTKDSVYFELESKSNRLQDEVNYLHEKISSFERRVMDSEIQGNNLQYAFNDLRDTKDSVYFELESKSNRLQDEVNYLQKACHKLQIDYQFVCERLELIMRKAKLL